MVSFPRCAEAHRKGGAHGWTVEGRCVFCKALRCPAIRPNGVRCALAVGECPYHVGEGRDGASQDRA